MCVWIVWRRSRLWRKETLYAFRKQRILYYTIMFLKKSVLNISLTHSSTKLYFLSFLRHWCRTILVVVIRKNTNRYFQCCIYYVGNLFCIFLSLAIWKWFWMNDTNSCSKVTLMLQKLTSLLDVEQRCSQLNQERAYKSLVFRVLTLKLALNTFWKMSSGWYTKYSYPECLVTGLKSEPSRTMKKKEIIWKNQTKF